MLSNFYVQAGHHSNGQSGCLFTWTAARGQDAGACVQDGVDGRDQEEKMASQFVLDYFRGRIGENRAGEPEPENGYIEANEHAGNFSVNHIKFGFDKATYRTTSTGTGLSSWRWGVSAEIRPLVGWMYDRLHRVYPRVRFGVVAGLSIGDFFGICKRFDEFVEIGLHGLPSGLSDWVSIAVQGTCMVDERQGLGWFVRYYSGQDYYNASFLNSISRVHAGFTINRLRVFGMR